MGKLKTDMGKVNKESDAWNVMADELNLVEAELKEIELEIRSLYSAESVYGLLYSSSSHARWYYKRCLFIQDDSPDSCWPF